MIIVNHKYYIHLSIYKVYSRVDFKCFPTEKNNNYVTVVLTTPTVVIIFSYA